MDPEIVQNRPKKPGAVSTEPFFSYLLHKVRDDRKNREEAARQAREEAQKRPLKKQKILLKKRLCLMFWIVG